MIGKDKVKLQVSITKELDDLLTDIVNSSKTRATPVTKSQLVEVALRNLIGQSMDQAKKGVKQ